MNQLEIYITIKKRLKEKHTFVGKNSYIILIISYNGSTQEKLIDLFNNIEIKKHKKFAKSDDFDSHTSINKTIANTT